MNNHLFQSSEFYQRRYHNFATLLVIPLSAITFFVTIFSLFAYTEVTVINTGEIFSTKPIKTIQSTSDNIIEINNLKNNKKVNKGELLIKYSDKLASSQTIGIKKQIDRDDRQVVALETLIRSLEQGVDLFVDNDEFGYSSTIKSFLNQASTITNHINQANASIAKQEESINQTNSYHSTLVLKLETQVSQYQELEEAIREEKNNLSKNNPLTSILNNFFSQITQNENNNNQLKAQYLSDIHLKIDQLQSSIDDLNIQITNNINAGTDDNSAPLQIETLRNQQISLVQDQLNQVKKEKEGLENQLKNLNIEQETTNLYSGHSGILHLNNQLEGASYIPKGTVIGEIVPDINKEKDISIIYYVNSNYIKHLAKHQTVRFTLNTIGNTPTSLEGKITSLDTVATKTQDGNMFRVTAKVNLSLKDRKKIAYGMKGKVTTVIAKKTFFNYFKDQFTD